MDHPEENHHAHDYPQLRVRPLAALVAIAIVLAALHLPCRRRCAPLPARRAPGVSPAPAAPGTSGVRAPTTRAAKLLTGSRAKRLRSP